MTSQEMQPRPHLIPFRQAPDRFDARVGILDAHGAGTQRTLLTYILLTQLSLQTLNFCHYSANVLIRNIGVRIHRLKPITLHTLTCVDALQGRQHGDCVISRAYKSPLHEDSMQGSPTEH